VVNHDHAIIQQHLLRAGIEVLVIDNVKADNVWLPDGVQKLRDPLVKLVVTGFDALRMTNRAGADFFVQALGHGFQGHLRFFKEGFGRRVAHGHLEMHLDFGGGGRGDGIDGMRGVSRRRGRCRFRWFVWDRDFFAARRAFDFRAGTLAVHGQFLFAIGAVEDDFHKPIRVDCAARLASWHFETNKKFCTRKAQPEEKRRRAGAVQDAKRLPTACECAKRRGVRQSSGAFHIRPEPSCGVWLGEGPRSKP